MDNLVNLLPKNLLEEFAKTDVLKSASDFYSDKRSECRYMFGYPAYNRTLSPLTQYLLLLHYNSPFSNNCGDINERGNYAMDSKDIEKKIVGLYAEKFSMGKDFWGYVTSGGSESNSCGISLAFAKNPNGILYYSQAAHYSVEKGASLHKRVKIPTVKHDRMDLTVLFSQIKSNFENLGAAANLVLTHGTTQYGACDDVDEIVSFLRKNNIPYYIHLDAALFGGIQNNQTDAPIITDAKLRGINSISVSLHKYVGFPDVKSVFVATEKPFGKEIKYIGQHDTTVSGSRSIPAFALYNHVSEQLHQTQTDLYASNIKYFEQLLKENGIKYYRAPLSNIFVINRPSPSLCKKYQLSCFEEVRGETALNKAHIIIFPSHEKEVMAELIKDLKNDV